MKKRLFILIYLSFCALSSYSQSSMLLDTNDISARIFADSSLFYGGFKVPKSSGKSSLFCSNLWIGGYDAGGQLHLAAQTYAQTGNDFYYGPIATNYVNGSYPLTYNTVWKINKSTIDNHLANFQTPGYIVPLSIADWPASGNTSNGESAKLAPYVDVNSNGSYDPVNGDYPDIRGDQAIFFMQNDEKDFHHETQGLKLKAEVQGMAYSFASGADSALNQTVFVNFKIINRSTINYDSVFVGVWADFDIGDPGDDYLGSDSALNLFYAYNSDNYDATYFVNPPAQGLTVLNYSVSKIIGYKNENSVNGNPFIATEFYNYLNGRWRTNIPLTYGGNGLSGTIPSNFIYSGNPDIGQGWTELSVPNPNGDRRGLLSIGPFSFQAGAELCLDIAYPFARDYGGTNLTSISLLKQRVQNIQAFYNNQSYACKFLISDETKPIPQSKYSIFPNPSNGLYTINSLNYSANHKTSYCVYDIFGQQKLHAEIRHRNEAVDLSMVSDGIYFLKIIDGEKSQSIKLIKNTSYKLK